MGNVHRSNPSISNPCHPFRLQEHHHPQYPFPILFTTLPYIKSILYLCILFLIKTKLPILSGVSSFSYSSAILILLLPNTLSRCHHQKLFPLSTDFNEPPSTISPFKNYLTSLFFFIFLEFSESTIYTSTTQPSKLLFQFLHSSVKIKNELFHQMHLYNRHNTIFIKKKKTLWPLVFGEIAFSSFPPIQGKASSM